MTSLFRALVLALTLSIVQTAQASVVFFADRSGFETVAPGLDVQTFSFRYNSMLSGPVDASTDYFYFTAGSILPGLTFSANPSNSRGDLATWYAGYAGNTNAALSVQWPFTALRIDLPADVSAVGLSLLSFLASQGSTVRVSVYDRNDSLLAVDDVYDVGRGSGVFLGMTATAGETFGHVTIRHTGIGSAGVDLVEYGAATPVHVSEPATLALAGVGFLGTLLARRRIAGFDSRRTRRTRR